MVIKYCKYNEAIAYPKCHFLAVTLRINPMCNGIVRIITNDQISNSS
jgi:hypothetical protein